jgi:hypothetical protein
MSAMVQRLALLIAGVFLQACTSGSSLPAAPTVPESATPLVGDVSLRYADMPAARAPLPLDIAIAVFDQGLQDPREGERVFPTVRKAESILLPVTLAAVLEESGAWGAVRVVHASDVHLPLLLDGKILRADGAELELEISLRGADGRRLFAKTYRDEATPADYPVAPGGEPFADIYRAISNDLLTLAATLDNKRRQTLTRLALMRFAADLSPASFERFLERSDEGFYALRSYPADDDPMFGRLARLRRQDDLFIDTVDEQYSDLGRQVAESYALWREYSFELQRFGDDYRASAADRKSSARRGSFANMQQVYASFRKVKIQEEDLRELVKGFSGESLETVLEVDDGVFRLSGSVQDRYDEWRKIVTRIYELETGAIEPSP